MCIRDREKRDLLFTDNVQSATNEYCQTTSNNSFSMYSSLSFFLSLSFEQTDYPISDFYVLPDAIRTSVPVPGGYGRCGGRENPG